MKKNKRKASRALVPIYTLLKEKHVLPNKRKASDKSLVKECIAELHF
jgi:hypothetical protein